MKSTGSAIDFVRGIAKNYRISLRQASSLYWEAKGDRHLTAGAAAAIGVFGEPFENVYNELKEGRFSLSVVFDDEIKIEEIDEEDE